MIIDGVHSKRFRANGKLMITGEYLVLDGARSLALPTRYGQSLQYDLSEGPPALVWKTYVRGYPWFEAKFSIPELAIANTTDFPTAQHIRNLLLSIKGYRPDFLSDNIEYMVNTEIEFDIRWGLGSSSSLLVNLAGWAEIDPFDLHFAVSEGSGYDIAASASDFPVCYEFKNRQPIIQSIHFDPPFKDNLYFAYLGKKRSSAEAIKTFNEKVHHRADYVEKINRITDRILEVQYLSDFIAQIRDHESLMSQLLGETAIGNSLFSGFKGAVKSLGAWGGDFALLATDYPRDYVASFLRKRHIKTWFSYKELILHKKAKPYEFK